jgi:hypothetical protein
MRSCIGVDLHLRTATVSYLLDNRECYSKVLIESIRLNNRRLTR